MIDDTHDLHDMLAGRGCEWSEMDRSRDEIADALATLTEEERYELGFSAWHERRSWEREAQERVARKWSLSMLRNFLTLAELDGDTATASRLRLEIAAVELGEECQAVCRMIETEGDLKALMKKHNKF